MALRIVADKIEEIPEGLRASAKQEGAVFTVATMPDGWAIEDVKGLKSSLSEARGERNALHKQVQAFGDLDPTYAAEAREALEQKRAGSLKSSKDLDEWKAATEKKFADERAVVTAKLDARTARLRDRMLRGDLAPIIAKYGGSDSMDAILTLAAQSIRIEEAGDDLKTSIVDAGGKPRVTKKGGSADPMGYEELIVEMREAPSTRGLFKNTAAGGTGGSSQTGGSGRTAGEGQQLSARELLSRAHAATG